uniref:Uncharacterized protein n=1 Tax=Micromonas pusilla TaxID=38833 RepID=A0A7S0NLH7_MICPS|mmetsp:Transcript_6417/g.26638  ORF Transcript_6417/g.26638 Transcript_6417/m.26638 type:complete len:592 (+) Transcript_6417:169-1944(+)
MSHGLHVNVKGDARVPLMDVSGNEMNNVNRFPSSKLKLDEFFLNWLSSPESQKLVLNLLDDAKAGRPLQAPTLPQTPTAASPLSPSSTNALFSAAPSLATPPLSPQKGSHTPPPGSPISPARFRSGDTRGVKEGQGAQVHKARRAADVIPRFYFGGEQLAYSDEQSAVKLAEAALLFNGGELDAEGMVQVTREVCELPGYFAPLLMHRINGTEPIAEDQTGADASAAPGALTAPAAAAAPVTWTKFTEYWNGTLRKYTEPNARVFEVLRGDKNNGDANGSGLNIPHLTHQDFRSVLRCVLDTHPGLEFLKDSPEFQDRYLETVTYRIFYQVNVAWNGRMTLREMRRSNLLEAMTHVDEEEDINKVLKYFSYEHFYVIYCKFWELDTDHDFLIDKEDLLRYGNHALTYRAVDRVFSQAPRRFVSGVDGKMGYEDFCWFVLSEEDKGNPLALEYWMRCVDLDGDGILSPSECSFFYEEQLQRMECLSQEPVLFEDILCQMSDMLHPVVPGRITLRDLRRCKLAGNFFNVLFNLNKFIAFETRDPFLIRQEREEPHLTEWDRFARQEYIRLSMEEEEGMQDGNWDGDGMDPSPF